MWDQTNRPIIRAGLQLSPQVTCPIPTGKSGFWCDAGDGAYKLRQANGTDVVVGVPSDGGAEFAARLYAAAALAACTYANGASGVGATLTANANGVLASVDGVTPAVGDVILVAAQAAPAQNGLYAVTSVGATGAPWILTRIEDMNQSAEFVAGFITAITAGTVYTGAKAAYTGSASPTLGTTALTFAIVSQEAQAAEQISASGALTPGIRTSILSVSGTKAYTLANGTKVGERKTVFCRAAVSTPVGVLTPASPHNFATLTFGAANEGAELEWNGTAWDLVDVSGSVTVA